MQVEKPIETETMRLYDAMAWVIDRAAMNMTKVHLNIEEMKLEVLAMFCSE